MLADPDLVPIEPPPEPRGLTGIPTLLRNYVESIPRCAYEQGVSRIQTWLADIVIACDPDLIQEILVEKATAFGRDRVTQRSFRPVIGDTSLFLAEGAEWRWQRRAVAPIFRHENLLSFVPIIAAMAERQVERWRQAPPGEPVDAAAAMTRTTFDVIVAAMLGGSANLDGDRYSRELVKTFKTIPWHLIYTVLGIPEWMPFPGRRSALRARDFLRADVARIVSQRRGKPAPQSDLLDLLMAARDPESGRSMTDDEVVANMITFIVAGHETTAVALTWALWLLAKDQDSQRRVLAEAQAAAGDGSITAAQVDNLAFTQQVLQEAMRLFPPVPAIERLPKQAMQIGGMEISERTRVNIPIFAVHRNTLLWDHPNDFDPDRFAPERAKARPRYAFLPFGGGPRVCIGSSLAMIEAAVVLATLVRAFRINPVAGHKPKPLVKLSLRPAGGMPLLIEPR